MVNLMVKVMTNKEAIKYLQQLYPNGGHCWLDEQRIEAIDMAIQALQEEPVSEELNKAAIKFSKGWGEWDYAIPCFKAGAQWQKQQMMRDAKSGIGNNDNYIQFEDGTWIDLDPSMQLKSAFNVKEGEKVKVLVIKED